MSNNKSTSSGIGYTGLLLIVFITLKLIGIIHWSWWWVLSPAWIVAVIVIILIVISVLLDDKVDEEAKLPKSKWAERFEEMQKKQKSEQGRPWTNKTKG